MIEWLEQIDRDLFLWLNALHAHWLDYPMVLISEKRFWIPLYLFLSYLLYKHYGWKATLWALLGAALVITAADRISVECFKEVFLRYRPSWNTELADQIHLVDSYRGGKYGFVSSHAANHFAIGTYLFLLLRKFYPKGAYLLLVWAVLVAYSRIYLGVHYPADVAVGGLVGAAIGWLIYLLFKRLTPSLA